MGPVQMLSFQCQDRYNRQSILSLDHTSSCQTEYSELCQLQTSRLMFRTLLISPPINQGSRQ